MTKDQVASYCAVSPALITPLVCVGWMICTPLIAESALRHSVIWYTPTVDATRIAASAARYQIGVTGSDMSSANQLAIKAANPNFLWFIYNSGSDNYVPPHSPVPEHDLLVSKALAHGWDPEEGYLHYWDDTQVTLEGTTVLIPGWGGGTAVNPADARVPVYYKNLERRVINASTGRARQLQKEVFIQLAIDTPFAGSSVYPDGIFLDNSTWQVYNYGTIVSGGHVREATNHPLMGSATFQSWYWNEDYGPFLASLKDTLRTAATWSKDHRPKYLMTNIANSWTDSYVTMDVADILSMEFEYNAVRDFGVNAVAEAHRRDRLAADAGIATVYPATMTQSVSGHIGSFSYAQTMLSNLAWYLVSRTELTYFFEMGSSAPNVAGWDTLTWRGCLDVADNDLGETIGEPYKLSQGTDPLGNAFAVYARPYQNGLALVRPRGDWDEGVETQSAVSVALPGPMFPVKPDGTSGSAVSQLNLRNGEGAILLSAPVKVELLSFTVDREATGAVLRWEIAGDATDLAGFHVYREGPAGSRERLTTDLLSGSQSYTFTDPAPPAGETRYWLADLARNGDVTWHGPVVLAGSGASPLGLVLSPNQPNPFQKSTIFSFNLTANDAPVLLRVIDVGGREVARLIDGPVEQGSHSVSWDGRDQRGSRLSPGLYIYEMRTQGRSLSKKLLLLP
jgi:flagellar hook capping protein FlgD